MDLNHVGIHDFYVFLLVFARVGGMMVAAPLLGNKAIPHMVKAGLAFVFAMSLVPLVAPHTGPIPLHPLLLAANVMKDALMGMCMGYLSRILFTAVEMAGYFIDTQMGFGFINLINPFSEQQSSPLSAFEYQLAITLFLLASGHLILLSAVMDSFKVLPPGAVSPHAGFGLTIVPMLRAMFALGLKIALPGVGVLMVMDVAFGFVARMVPQINVFIVGIPAKIIIGLATVAMLLPVMAVVIGQIVAGTAVGYESLIAGAK